MISGQLERAPRLKPAEVVMAIVRQSPARDFLKNHLNPSR